MPDEYLPRGSQPNGDQPRDDVPRSDIPRNDIESLLRDTLSERSMRAPQSGLVEQRILAGARRGPTRRARSRWLMPVTVACSVLLVIGATAGGVALVRNLSNGTHPAVVATGTSTATAPATTRASSTASTPGSSGGGPTRAATTTPAPTSTPVTPVAPVGPVGGPVPKGFRVTDLTFVSTLEGWALGTTATCPKRPCTSLVRTTDGGQNWRGITPPVVGLLNVDSCPSTSPCVSGVRFASPLVGYLFGPDVLYLTTNGGANWSKQIGGATALDIAGDTVLRVSTTGGCSPGCPYVVDKSVVGSTSWHQVLAATSSSQPAGAGLVQQGSTAYVQIYGNPAGGAAQAHTTLWASTDNGTSWTNRGEPCPQTGSTEVDSTSMTAGQKGTLAVLCRPRGGSTSFVATFARNSTKPVSGVSVTGLSAPIGAISTSVVFAQRPRASGVSQGVLVRSADGGRTWSVAQTTKIPPSSYSPGFLGFETATTGRWVSPADPSTVWTTTDAGRSWTYYTFRG